MYMYTYMYTYTYNTYMYMYMYMYTANSKIQSLRSKYFVIGFKCKRILLEIFHLTKNTSLYSVYHGLEVKSPLMCVM